MAIYYELDFPNDWREVDVELHMVKHFGKYKGHGNGMFHHIMKARELLWPERYRHEWTDLLYTEFIKNDVTVCMGAASTQKTSHACEYVLIKYWANPHNTLVILSTIDMGKLDTGVWAEVKMLWKMARERYPYLAGNMIDHKRSIATDNIDAGDVRDMRKGIVSKPCFVNGQWVGLGSKLIGTKQDNILFLADELPFMSSEFLGSWANLFSNPHVQIIGSGNPQGDPDDQLGIAAEPKEGWASIGEPTTTTCWDTRYMGGRCVNLVGTDSPNFKAVAAGKREPYPKLIGPKFAERTAQNFGIDSHQYYSQVRGIMKIGMVSDRVITRQICRDHHAHDKAVWAGMTPRKKVHGLDPSYGGNDACVSTILEFGKGVDGNEIMRVLLKKEHRFNLNSNTSVEDQIAEQVDTLLKDYGIPPEDSFYDPYGKGTLGFAFARKFGSNCPIPVDSGGLPTERPVRHDLFIVDKGLKRHKKCSEHYRKFVTEAWFSVRYIIEADQMREFPEDTMMEMAARKYEMVGGDKIEIEPKDKLKERTGKSPNKGDSMAIAVEGARQRGFRIGRLGSDIDNEGESGFQWLKDKRRDHEDMMAKQRLTYA